MGSFTSPALRRARSLGALLLLLSIVLNSPAARATDESILLPGYVRPSVPIPTVGATATPTILPGWAAANPGFILAPNPSGLKLIVDNSWPNLPGYRLIRLEFQASPPAAEDRHLRVQIKLQNSNFGRAETTVTSDEIVLPAGQSAVKYQLYYPAKGQQYLSEVRTTEDGERLPDLCCNVYIGQQNRTQLPFLDLTKLGTNPNQLAMTFNTQGSTGIKATADAITQGTAEDYRNRTVFSFPVNHGWTGIPNLGELPNNPLGYSCFEIVICGTEQLTDLQANHPAQWNALRSWVAIGGKLLVLPQRSSTESTQDSQLQLDRLFAHGKPGEKNSPDAAWNNHNISTIPEPIQRSQQSIYFDDSPVMMPQPQGSNPSGTGRNGPMIAFPERAWFQGTLAILPSEQNFDAIYSYLQNASQQPLPSTPLPQVGLPPITMFQILITLFVILIGPVNYFYFKKKKKLSWLLITVPAGALAITGLLLGYTLFKDGIGVRSWSQSYTILDQNQELASTRHQFCLFAGITPGDGLRYRGQTDFSELNESNVSNYGYSYRYRDTRNWEFSWEPPPEGSSGIPEQHLRTGWLPARTLKLYENREFAAAPRQLRIQISGESCQLVNKLGSKVRAVYVADGDKVWNATELEPEGSAAATLVDAQKVQNLQANLEQELFRSASSYNLNERSFLPPQDRTIQERFLGARRLNSKVYLAIVENWPALQSGVTNATAESWGPHVILGVW